MEHSNHIVSNVQVVFVCLNICLFRPVARQLMTSIEDLKSEHEDTYSTYGEASKMELVQLLESIKMDTRRRGSSFVENGQMMELEEKTMDARITQLQVRSHRCGIARSYTCTCTLMLYSSVVV